MMQVILPEFVDYPQLLHALITHIRLDAQLANPHVGGLPLSGDTPYH